MKDQKKVILNSKVIDGTGNKPIKDAVIVINGSLISEIGSKIDLPDDAQIIDANGKTVIPGLIDAHTHLGSPILPSNSLDTIEQNTLSTIRSVHSPIISMYSLKNAQTNLMSGFTTLKELSWVWDPLGIQAIAVRNAINMGFFTGPRIVVYPWVGMTGGHCDMRLWFCPSTPPNLVNTGGPIVWPPIATADGVSEILKRVRESMRLGGDGIKTSSDSYELWGGEKNVNNYNIDEMKILVEETHRHHKLVSMHASSNDGIIHAINAGADIIEHCTYPSDDAIEQIIKENIITSATLGDIQGPKPLQKIEDTFNRKNPSYNTNLERKEYFHKKYKAGVKMAMGTDICHEGSSHGLAARGTASLVEYGMSNIDAIISSTKMGAKACGLDKKLGTLEKGKYADILIIDGDPLDNIKVLMNTSKIKVIMKNGEFIKNKLEN
jgi:imidazolonepropionase-like amidohydrolase